ncbi:Ppx/GppA phosphatase family protein [Solwaraspora sp. WMMB335]|uniref:Ppx/GppA phosphatase family protein n=1 Tax=Solwaraspora sp. WMMB335 TaxID=3404118 RepID=UPI003B9381EB
MRLGVLDVGSNTVHLLVVDAHPGAHPWPAHSEKSLLRLAEQTGPDGALTTAGADALVEAVSAARSSAVRWQTSDLIAFATSAVRDAANSAAVLARVRAETGVQLQVLSGADEARMTFLAVRRWFGWSAGRLLVLDIGGGSLELACGVDEEPHLAESLPLGAGRLTREWLDVTPLTETPPPAQRVADLRDHVDAQVQLLVPQVQAQGWDQAVGTSKTFRTLARLTGAAPSSAGLWAPRRLTRTGLRQVSGFIRHIPPAELSELEGVSASRGHQLLAGAVVAESVMRQLGIESLDICPWALREGVILRRMARLELMSG